MVSLSAEVFLAKLFPQKGHLFSTLISWVAGAARALQMLCKPLTPPPRPRRPMNTVTQLHSDQSLMIQPLRPSKPATAAQHLLVLAIGAAIWPRHFHHPPRAN